ncbi:shikimate kinase [Pelagirhabdus alkalitolerans]|uniref:Shikimate kinase n=1 Tax=Pelagirhabdus alkalitolerans TaxID=1612202 RepID=A0A1G6HZ47_9BACI|nr:shikimate kinase [Pelagirhabdus alkalitolerans]
MDSLYLIGFMGSGKSTIGKVLSKRLNVPLYDMDNEIVLKAEKEIKDIFAEEGESVFRDYETTILKQMPTKDAIISTGGGVIEREDNREWLKNKQSIYLRVSFDTVKKRLKKDASRPLWNDSSKDKKELLNQRDPKYTLSATYTIDVDSLSVEEVVDEIVKTLNLHEL